MANVAVYYLVQMSYSHTESDAHSVGTQGLGPCLGMIIRKGNRVFCGHLSCGLAGTEDNLPRIAGVAHRLAVMTDLKPIDSIAFASRTPDPTTRAMHDAFNQFFGTNAPITRAFGIYWKDQAVQYLGDNDTMSGTVKSPRDPTQKGEPDGPFNVR